MDFKIEALDIVYKHWITEEIAIRKEVFFEMFKEFIENRESVKHFKKIMNDYWNDRPITIPDESWLKNLEFQPFGSCIKCKKNIMRFQLFEYEECYQVWVKCENLNCRRILRETTLYLNKPRIH